MWNVNFFNEDIYGFWDKVVIETLWNVNCFCKELGKSSEIVVIETLWNVNVSYVNNNVTLPCCNRDIVECKLELKYEPDGQKDVVIETLWNVNLNRSIL